jgi:hypothetical protein
MKVADLLSFSKLVEAWRFLYLYRRHRFSDIEEPLAKLGFANRRASKILVFSTIAFSNSLQRRVLQVALK